MKSLKGVGYGGKAHDPAELPEEPEDSDTTKAAPAPGVPISEKEYKRLKREAEHSQPPTHSVKDKAKERKRKRDGT